MKRENKTQAIFFLVLIVVELAIILVYFTWLKRSPSDVMGVGITLLKETNGQIFGKGVLRGRPKPGGKIIVSLNTTEINCVEWIGTKWSGRAEFKFLLEGTLFDSMTITRNDKWPHQFNKRRLLSSWVAPPSYEKIKYRVETQLPERDDIWGKKIELMVDLSIVYPSSVQGTQSHFLKKGLISGFEVKGPFRVLDEEFTGESTLSYDLPANESEYLSITESFKKSEAEAILIFSLIFGWLFSVFIFIPLYRLWLSRHKK